MNHILFQKIKCVYIHHNLLYGHKWLTRMPEYVVAIADKGVENLNNYFGVPIENITKIHNCVKDIHPDPHKLCDGKRFNVLYPARINGQKRQLEVVEHLKGKLDSRIRIKFVGDGPYLDNLKKATAGDTNFEVLGHRNDVLELLQGNDYMMLFSGHEGLPITIIEAVMTGTPVLCNNVGGNAEIIENGINGFLLEKDDWEGLVQLLNSLPMVTPKEYNELSANCRRIYEEKFTYEKFKNSYLSLIDKIN